MAHLVSGWPGTSGRAEEGAWAQGMQGSGGARGRIAATARDILEEDLTRRLPIAARAERCETSPTVLKEAFHATYGMPVYEWFRRRRMVAATRMIVRTSMPIHEIGASVGYANASKFARAFKDVFGMGPSELRRRCIASGRLPDLDPADASEAGPGGRPGAKS